MTFRNVLVIIVCTMGLILFSNRSHCAEPTMTDYTAYPSFLISTPKPNVLILLDNSGSMFNFAYDFNDGGLSQGYDPSTEYYGYFDSDTWYVYPGNQFEAAAKKSSRAKAANEWDGNFLNWLTMRRVDIARRVLVGGKAVARSLKGDPHQLIGEQADQSVRGYLKEVADATPYTPYSGRRCFTFNFGSSNAAEFVVADSAGSCPCPGADDYVVKVEIDHEPIGLIQAQGDRVRWGLMFFNDDAQGGGLSKEITDAFVSSMVTGIEDTRPGAVTCLAEALWTATGYFAQDPTTGDTGPRYHVANSESYRVGSDADPFNYGTGGTPEYIPCAKSFVLAITDGESSYDDTLPSSMEGYYPPYTDDSSPVPSWAGPADPNFFWYNDNFGTHYVDDVALWSRADIVGNKYRDLRSDLDGDQYLTSYFVYVNFDDAVPDSRRLLKQAARNGGFEDRNGNFLPDLPAEYDENGDGDPDTYFEASNGRELSASLTAAILDMLRRTSSGTSVSVLSTSADGEGALFQAYFKPEQITSMGDESTRTNWVGYLQGLWVDDHGNLREDNGDFKLVYEEDDIVQYYAEKNGTTRVRRDLVSSGQPYGDGSWDETDLSLNNVGSLWEAGKELALRDISANPRKIYTSLDKQTLVELDPALPATFQHYLRASSTDQARDIIRYTMGEEVAGMRPRRLFVDTDGDSTSDQEGVWRLGDIVFSTPAVVGRPMENYDDIYSDPTYGEYEWQGVRGPGTTYAPRPTVVYVGANDGMLHAFNAGVYVPGDDGNTPEEEHGRYTEADYPAYFTTALGHSPERGEELWAYIPHNLLPHLRWLTDPNYTHVYYVDMKSKIVDARIFSEDAFHQTGWGTVLIGALNFGGGTYTVDDFNQDGTKDDPRTFSSCYFALDITNPGAPELLWEFNDPGTLGFTTAYPAVARTGAPDEKGQWYVVFGSGPTRYDGTSSQQASIFVLDLRTGTLLRRISGAPIEANSFMGGAATMDMNLDYQTNAVYLGQTYDASGIWKGKLLRLFIATPDTELYPAPNGWSASLLATTKDEQPITAPPGIAMDHNHTPWVFWGTGRFFSGEDKLELSTQSFYGVKDRTLTDGSPAEGKGPADLTDVSNVVVTFGKPSTVTGAPDVVSGSSWDEMLNSMMGDEFSPSYGWYLDVTDIWGPKAGERVLTKPSIFGGLVMFSSFKPQADICERGGQGRLYALYYETGTAFRSDAFGLSDPPLGTELERSVDLGLGRPSGVGFHIGQEKGGKVYIQQSTGIIEELLIKTPLHMKSGAVSWYEE